MIYAGTVSVTPPPKPPRWKRVLVAIGWTAGVLAAVVAILQYFGIVPHVRR